MANSLRAKISKLRHDGNITDAEYQELIKKLDGHDKQIRDQAIDEFKSLLYQFGYYDAFTMKFEIYHDDLNRLIRQLKEQRDDSM